MNNPPLSALILGDAGPDEFRPVIELVHRQMAAGSLREAADFATFQQMNGSGWFPDLLIALQAWPDQFSEDDVGELISLFPLARILCCFGPWCDSDGRTRSIWPLGVRVPVGAFASRFEQEVALLANSRGVRPPLPLTASRTEIFEFDFARPTARHPSAQGVSVISPDRRFRDMLASAFQTAGFPARESPDTDPVRETHDSNQPATIVFDADPWDGDRAQALATICTAHPQSQVVACVGFPRPHIDAELRRSGADAVWFKLAPLSDLIEHLTAQRALGTLPLTAGARDRDPGPS